MLARRLASGPPVLPEPFRGPAAVLVAVAAVTFVALSVKYAGDSGEGRFDSAAADVAQDQLAPFGRVFSAIARLGSPIPLVVMILALAILCLLLRRYRLALLAILGPAITGGATIVLKPLIGRTRGDDLAFPSGHAAGLMALSLVAALLVLSFARSRLVLVAALCAAGVVIAATTIGIAVSTRGGHYLTDTVGSFCLAVAIVLGIALLLDRWWPRLFRTGSSTGSRTGEAASPDRPASATR